MTTAPGPAVARERASRALVDAIFVPAGQDRIGEGPKVSHADQAAYAFVRARPRLLGIACRILRNPFEAEDVVQDAWLRWQGTNHTTVTNAQAFLATTTTRLALNQAQSARRRWETPVGPWLSELSEPTDGPESHVERGEAVELAIFLMLAKLTPPERAAYVLREAFGYRYDRIAELLQLGAANCRQLARRARQRMASERPHPVSAAAHKRLLQAFLAAAQDGYFTDLEHLLVTDVRRQGGRKMGRRDLKRIEENVEAELEMAESTVPSDEPVSFTTFDPTDPLASDPTDVLRYEIGLSGLREAVLGLERLEEGDDGSA